jgi:hypothetical protein
MGRAGTQRRTMVVMPLRRRSGLLCFALFCVFAISCGASFAPSSQVEALRVLAVRAEPSYVSPGETVRFEMTAVDALGDEARPIQVVWIGGCINPVGDQYFACYPQLGKILANLGAGAASSELISMQEIAPEMSGRLGGSVFEWQMPDDIVSARPAPDVGPHYGIAYVFFAACAGQLAPAEISTEGSVPAFPLVCLDEEGNHLGADSFVPGYTQVYAFADERRNAVPLVEGIVFDGDELSEAEDDSTEVPTCPVLMVDRLDASQGCGGEPLENRCAKHELKAIIGDVAELNPDGEIGQEASLRETVWVEYFSDGGSFETSLKLVSDARTGYVGEHETAWYAPNEAGIVNIWAVSRDQRGGSSIVHRVVRVLAP